MDTFQSLMVIFAFGGFLLSLLTYIERKRKQPTPCARVQWATSSATLMEGNHRSSYTGYGTDPPAPAFIFTVP
jgi:hypothetical protein